MFYHKTFVKIPNFYKYSVRKGLLKDLIINNKISK
jgi:hypothetical protein